MNHKGDGLLLLAAAIGGGGFISVKYLLDDGFTPYQVIFGRFLLAAVCLGVLYGKESGSMRNPDWKVGWIFGV